MTRKRRRFTADFKKRVALEALRERDTVQMIAARYDVHPNQVSAWKRQAVEGLDEVFSQPGSKRGGEHESTIRNLHAKIGELTVERRHRIRRLMRLMGMEAVYRKPRTSVANPEHRVYPYLLRDLVIDRPDQVWCADITYIPVSQGFFYLVAVMDWASRHVLSWRLSNTMDSAFCVEALTAALRFRVPEIFNTDQGAQFTSIAFTEKVRAAGALCSMDGRGRPRQHLHRAAVRSLKYEAVYLHELADGRDAERLVASWFAFYNELRPHASLHGRGRTPGDVYRDTLGEAA